MKRIFTVLLCLLCAAASELGATTWTAKSNAELREAMLERAADFRGQMAGEEIYNALTDFICEVKALADSDPYAWLMQTHKFVSAQLRRYPACLDIPFNSKEKNSTIRKNLLYLRDFPMHEDNSSSVPAAQSEAFTRAYEYYLGEARADFLQWLNSPAPSSEGELQMFKVYNMGFAFRTSKHLALIDIHWDGTDEEAAFIASKADILFLTHNHSDHYSQPLLNAMAKEGKYLVMPLDKVPSYTDTAKKLVKASDFDAVDLGGVSVQAFLGYQNGVDNLLYAIEMDGWRIAHGGDNQSADAEAKFKDIEGFDIATIAIFARPQSIMGCIMQSQNQSSRDFVFLSSHENEKGHDVAGRVGFDQAYEETNKFGSSSFDYPAILILDNGEKVSFKK